MDITNKSVTELKAIAFDLIVQQETTAKNLQYVNQLISEKLKAELTGNVEASKEEPKAE